MEPGAVDPEVPLETETELPEGRIASSVPAVALHQTR